MFMKRRGIDMKPEGIVFHSKDGKMSKLRIDMYDDFKGNRHNDKRGEQNEKTN